MGNTKNPKKPAWKEQPGKLTRGQLIPDYKKSSSRKVQDSKSTNLGNLDKKSIKEKVTTGS